MKENLGIADRVIRILVAVAALYFIGIISGTLGIILMIVAIVFLLTSFIKVCPAYMPFGLDRKSVV